ncbi:MAG: DHA2 family efflux MFS transporter permease subunit [Alphaproteobacteria bacterium]|nr:DHA2 family efflux MFS transporter permease subunit [Alphaproteobacteria bacterium]
MLATIMQALDMTIANVALPYMQGSLSATLDQINWVLTSYIVAAAIMTPITGFMAARFGRKRFLLASVAGFTVASLLCGIAASLEQMVVFRLLQGIFGAPLVPLSQAVLLDYYPRSEHGRAMAIWGVGVMVGPILGPTLGAYLTDLYHWRYVFYINLPVGVVTFLGLSAFLGEQRAAKPPGFDWFGFGALGLAIGALQMLLDRGQQLDWFSSREIVCEAVVAALAFYLFVVHMFTTREPFIEPRMFRDRNLSTGIVMMFFMGVILLATLALLTPFLQGLLDYPVRTAGLLLAPRGIGTMVAMMIVGRIIHRVDPRLLILFGLALVAVALWEMTEFSLDVSQAALFRTGLVQGVGLGFVFVPLSTVAFSTLEPRYRNQGTALFSLMRNIGSSIGISVMIFLLDRSTRGVQSVIVEQLTPMNDLLRAPSVAALWNLTTDLGRARLDAEVTRQATLIAYLNDFKIMMVVALVTMPLVLLLRGPQRRRAAAKPAAKPPVEAAAME